MPTKIIVTHEGAMKKKYGPAGWATVNAALKRLIAADRARGITARIVPLDDPSLGQWRAVTGKPPTFKTAIDHAFHLHHEPDYVLIVGGPDVVPHQQLRNPLTGDDRDDDPIVPSDLPYACEAPADRDVERFVGPSRVVGRIPDLPHVKSPGLLVALVDSAATWKPASSKPGTKHFGLTAQVWEKSTRLSLRALFGRGGVPKVSPVDGPLWAKKDLGPVWHFINCHGAQSDPQFYGQKGRAYPVAHQSTAIAKIVARGTVVAAECCYGAELYDPRAATAQGIGVTYLEGGAIGFVGSTTIAYGPDDSNAQADILCRYFLESSRNGATLGRALLEARQRYVADTSSMSPVDLKTLAQFLLLGDPSLRAVKGAATKLTGRALERHTATRGRLASRATILTRTTESVGSDADAASPASVRQRLMAAARDAGWVPVDQPRAFDVRSAPDAQARGLMAARKRAPTRYHVLFAKPSDAMTSKKGARGGDGMAVPKRLLLLGHEVAGKMVAIERLYAHLHWSAWPIPTKGASSARR
jgi:peptidase C25-like protein